MGQLQNQFQQMGGQSPYSGGGGGQQRSMGLQQGLGRGFAGGQQRGNFGDPRYQQSQVRGSGAYSGMPQNTTDPPIVRGIDQMRQDVDPRYGGGQTGGFKTEQGQHQFGPPMPKSPPVQAPPPGTGGIKPQRDVDTPTYLGPPVQAPPDGAPIAPITVQGQAGTLQGGSVSAPLASMQPSPHQGGYQGGYQGGPQHKYKNPYKQQPGYGGPRPDGGPEFMY